MRILFVAITLVCFSGLVESRLFAGTNAVLNLHEQTLQGIWAIAPAPRPSWAVGDALEESIHITASNYIHRFKEQAGFKGLCDQAGTSYPWITDDDGVRYCVIERTYQIDTSTIPHQIDLSNITKDGTVQISKGIYNIEGDDLLLCYGKPGMQRASTFQVADNDYSISIVHAKRVKYPITEPSTTKSNDTTILSPTTESGWQSDFRAFVTLLAQERERQLMGAPSQCLDPVFLGKPITWDLLYLGHMQETVGTSTVIKLSFDLSSYGISGNSRDSSMWINYRCDNQKEYEAWRNMPTNTRVRVKGVVETTSYFLLSFGDTGPTISFNATGTKVNQDNQQHERKMVGINFAHVVPAPR